MLHSSIVWQTSSTSCNRRRAQLIRRSDCLIHPLIQLYNLASCNHLILDHIPPRSLRFQLQSCSQHSHPPNSCSRPAFRSANPRQQYSSGSGSRSVPILHLESISSGATHGPSGESQLHLTPALSLQPLVILQAAADGAGSDRKVFVVATSVSALYLESRSRRSPIARAPTHSKTYVRPEDFHAKVMLGSVVFWSGCRDSWCGC